MVANKQTTETPKPQVREVVEVLKSQTAIALPVEVQILQQDSGLGRESMGMQDMALPYLVILQSLSPQIKKSSPNKVEGAEEGDLLNSVTQELYTGSEGLLVIPCAFQKAWVEWRDRDSGGGWVASYETDDIMGKCKKNEKGIDVRQDNNNNIIPTYYYYVIIVKENDSFEYAIVPMSRTQMKRGRKWNMLMTNVQIQGANGPFNPPMFSQKYHLGTEPDGNVKGDWYSYTIKPEGAVTSARLYGEAKLFADQVRRGLVKVSAPISSHEEAAVSSTVSVSLDKTDEVF